MATVMTSVGPITVPDAPAKPAVEIRKTVSGKKYVVSPEGFAVEVGKVKKKAGKLPQNSQETYLPSSELPKWVVPVAIGGAVIVGLVLFLRMKR